MTIVGIDVGLSGALVAITSDGLDLRVMPVVTAGGKNHYDERALVDWLTPYAIRRARVFIEAVHAMPKQGVTSMFTFGTGYGLLRGIRLPASDFHMSSCGRRNGSARCSPVNPRAANIWSHLVCGRRRNGARQSAAGILTAGWSTRHSLQNLVGEGLAHRRAWDWIFMLEPNDMLSTALEYAAMGYPVFPCWRGSKRPMTKHGFKDASTDIAQIQEWWTKFTGANIAIYTRGLMVVDIDGAQNAWLSNDARLLDIARGPVARTPRGGYHYFMRQPGGKQYRCTTGRLANKVDTRADGGYVLVAPSVKDGAAYAWQSNCDLVPLSQLPLAPDWLCQMLDALEFTKRTEPAGDGNLIPMSQRNSTLTRLAGSMRRIGMTETEILAGLQRINTDRCKPPLQNREVEKVAHSIANYAPNEMTVARIEDHLAQSLTEVPELPYRPAFDLCKEYKAMNPPIIHGLLREGETMNVIAAPKTGKSWLVLNLALAVTAGKPWLNFKTEPGNVLLIDNELHPETLANRIPRVADAMKLTPEIWRERFFVQTLRGKLQDLFRMESYFRALPPGQFKVIVLDAFYRFMPRDMDENDNGTMASLYNLLDRCADHLRCAFVLIHHTTKGLQSGKSITDVGAGAGSQSRAADGHLVLRPQEIDNCLSVHAVARSWPSPPPFAIRQEFPLWIPDPRLNPEALKKPESSQRRSSGSATPRTEWTVETFVAEFITEAPQSKSLIAENAEQADVPIRRIARLIEIAEEHGFIHRWQVGPQKALGYATTAPPADAIERSKRDSVLAMLRSDPQIPSADVAEQCDASLRYVQKLRHEMGESDAKNDEKNGVNNDANNHANNDAN